MLEGEVITPTVERVVDALPPLKINEARDKAEVPVIPRCELESWTKFSECHLWKLMMSFYDRQGVDSWSQGIVPHFITCNSFIGNAYAKSLYGFLMDCMRPDAKIPLDVDEPLYIVELGAGSGKFSFFMVQALVRLKDLLPFPLKNIKYIMTDFTQQNFDFWTTHPALSQYVQDGLIDFAIFNATVDTSITLSRSNITLSPGSVKNPVCVVANYLFDTLYHDLFRVEKGVLKEGLISVGSKNEYESDPLDPTIIKRLSNEYQYREIDQTSYYQDKEGDDEALNEILSWYQSYYTHHKMDATVLVPIGALRAIRRLCALSNRQAFVMSGDKGHNNPDHFQGLCDPHIAVHGSFSVMVNYHAIGIYFASLGGYALHNPQEEASLKVSAFILGGEMEKEAQHPEANQLEDILTARACDFPHLMNAFNDFMVSFGPNDFFVIQKGLKEDAKAPSLRTVTALLKLSNWDPDVFYKFRDAILDQIGSCGPKLRADLCFGMPLIWKNFYMLDKDKDIAFEIGRFYYGIRDYENALKYYTISMDTVGPHHVTFHNMGLCQYSQGHLKQALIHFEKAVARSATYEKAKTWQERVARELEPPNNPMEVEVVV